MNEQMTTDAISSFRSAATILVVDDDPVNLGLLNAVLRPHFSVRVASSGADALRVAETEPLPSLVLLDVMMPGMDGYAVLEKLRESPSGRDIPFEHLCPDGAHVGQVTDLFGVQQLLVQVDVPALGHGRVEHFQVAHHHG